MTALIIVALIGFGLIFGSFVNALVWRMHAQDELKEQLEKLRAKKKTKDFEKTITESETHLRELSMSKGRSMCSKCHHPLAPNDLVPLLSWLWLRGKCRYCRKPIEDTPLLEAGLPVAFVV
jgi:prepilin signal peptidase PulO-like enzyme (type II secretory pathway)